MSDDITRRSFIGVAAALALTPVPGTTGEQAAAVRLTLRAAVDRIIPAQGKMPSASAAGAVAYIESLAARDQDFRQRLAKAMAAIGDGFAERPAQEQVDALTALEQADAPSFATLRDIVFEAYYTNPKIWALIGYSFRRGPKKTATLEAFDTTLLARVQQLKPLYRDVE